MEGAKLGFFWHAVHNGRPLSIITARGHHPDGIKAAVSLLVKKGHLSREPNYLSVFPVSHSLIRKQLGDVAEHWHTAKLKKAAIHYSVKEAFRVYGFNAAHRFGMSDDDPANLALVTEALQELKIQFPSNSFYIIDTQNGRLLKHEVFTDSVRDAEPFGPAQLNLFGERD